MADWSDVRRVVAALPETAERPSYGGLPAWRVHGALFAWERPLGRAERASLGSTAPPESEPLLGIRVEDEGVKAALLAEEPGLFLTTPHFDGHPSVLVRLARVDPARLTELPEEAWRAQAPRRLHDDR